mgnify:FL=1|jgi:hypothetical protein
MDDFTKVFIFVMLWLSLILIIEFVVDYYYKKDK